LAIFILGPPELSARRSSLKGRDRVVFSKRAVLRAAVCLRHAARDPDLAFRRGVQSPVVEWRSTEHAPEARCELAEALRADSETDVGNRPIGRAQQVRSSLQPARQQVLVRRLAKDLFELATEMSRGQVGGGGQIGDRERLEIPGVGEVFCPEQVAG